MHRLMLATLLGSVVAGSVVAGTDAPVLVVGKATPAAAAHEGIQRRVDAYELRSDRESRGDAPSATDSSCGWTRGAFEAGPVPVPSGS